MNKNYENSEHGVPVHCTTQYLFSCDCFFLIFEFLVFGSDSSLTGVDVAVAAAASGDALHLIRQKKERRAPGHKQDAPVTTSALTGIIAVQN